MGSLLVARFTSEREERWSHFEITAERQDRQAVPGTPRRETGTTSLYEAPLLPARGCGRRRVVLVWDAHTASAMPRESGAGRRPSLVGTVREKGGRQRPRPRGRPWCSWRVAGTLAGACSQRRDTTGRSTAPEGDRELWGVFRETLMDDTRLPALSSC